LKVEGVVLAGCFTHPMQCNSPTPHSQTLAVISAAFLAQLRFVATKHSSWSKLVSPLLHATPAAGRTGGSFSEQTFVNAGMKGCVGGSLSKSSTPTFVIGLFVL